MAGGGAFKKRPAVVLGSFQYGADDCYLLCAISATEDSDDSQAIFLRQAQMKSGSLLRDSWIRPRFAFTVIDSAIDRKVGQLTGHFIEETLKPLRELLG